MIDYSACDKADLSEILESFVYKLLRYEHPNWHSILEEDVYSALKEEGLIVTFTED